MFSGSLPFFDGLIRNSSQKTGMCTIQSITVVDQRFTDAVCDASKAQQCYNACFKKFMPYLS